MNIDSKCSIRLELVKNNFTRQTLSPFLRWHLKQDVSMHSKCQMNKGKSVNDVERADIISDSWTLSTLPLPLQIHAVCRLTLHYMTYELWSVTIQTITLCCYFGLPTWETGSFSFNKKVHHKKQSTKWFIYDIFMIYYLLFKFGFMSGLKMWLQITGETVTSFFTCSRFTCSNKWAIRRRMRHLFREQK